MIDIDDVVVGDSWHCPWRGWVGIAEIDASENYYYVYTSTLDGFRLHRHAVEDVLFEIGLMRITEAARRGRERRSGHVPGR